MARPSVTASREQDILSLVVQIDPALVATDGPVLAVWASTHAAQ